MLGIWDSPVFLISSPSILCQTYFYSLSAFHFFSLISINTNYWSCHAESSTGKLDLRSKKAMKSTSPHWKSIFALKTCWLQKFSIMLKNLIQGLCCLDKSSLFSIRGIDWGHGTKASPSVQRWAWMWVEKRDSSWSRKNLLKGGHVIALWSVTDHIVIKWYC